MSKNEKIRNTKFPWKDFIYSIIILLAFIYGGFSYGIVFLIFYVIIKQKRFKKKIKELQEKLLHVVIIEDGANTSDVSIGNTVLVRDVEFGDDMEYRIVGTTEADISAGKISNESPLGKALMGKKVGEIARVAAPNGAVIEYEILEIK
jgi:transcription elongation GreA/GreB family factor